MILTIDIGNSNIVLGAVDGEKIAFEARLRTDSTKTSDEYCIDLMMIAKYLERIGDHAVNVAEWVEFSITGAHKQEEGPL